MKRNILLLFTFFACITVQGQTPVRLVDLRSEHLDRPIGLDNPVPRLSWRMEDGRQGAVQTSWRIVVDEDSLNVVNGCGRMWDSGKNDSRNLLVAYAGKKLQPFTRYYWKVICSDMEYKETASPVSYFETGMMGMQHWQGAWIGDGKDIHYGPAPYFRKEFKTGKKVKSARAYIAAAGATHPECDPAVVAKSDFVGSTSQIINFVASLPQNAKVAVGTEFNLVNRLTKQNGNKENIFILSSTKPLCPTMHETTLEDLYAVMSAFKDDMPYNEICENDETIKYAKMSLEKMLELS